MLSLLIYHSEHLVLHHPECTTRWIARKCSPCLLIPLVFIVSFISMGEGTTTIIVSVAIIAQIQIVPISKGRPIACIITNCVVGILEFELLLEIEGEDER